MQSAIVSMNNKKGDKVYCQLCSKPNKEQKEIFNALNFKHRPYVRKTNVVPH